jgi:predicted dithiol-disulfide oxidoreductase (DUF899 family)
VFERLREMPGLSVFLRDGDRLFHTYSTYTRGLDQFLNTYNFLDHMPLGRQEHWARKSRMSSNSGNDSKEEYVRLQCLT